MQLTDLHVIDAQHPLRLEYLRSTDVHAWRPHEALTVHGAVLLVERINALRGAPVTGSPLHFAMTTGDNTDNNTRSELDWFLTALSGGRITPNSGDPRHYEGVQAVCASTGSRSTPPPPATPTSSSASRTSTASSPRLSARWQPGPRPPLVLHRLGP
ncbi:hypothetical protein SHIRM173S_13363 [Streptomyces hirsutus]